MSNSNDYSATKASFPVSVEEVSEAGKGCIYIVVAWKPGVRIQTLDEVYYTYDDAFESAGEASVYFPDYEFKVLTFEVEE